LLELQLLQNDVILRRKRWRRRRGERNLDSQKSKDIFIVICYYSFAMIKWN
jgi:hypothetical protein